MKWVNFNFKLKLENRLEELNRWFYRYIIINLDRFIHDLYLIILGFRYYYGICLRFIGLGLEIF